MRKKLTRKLTRFLCILLTMVTFVCSISTVPVYAADPKFNAPVTKKNVMALLDKYDKGAAYILRTMSNNGDDILSWWNPGTSLTDGIEVAVHEEFHGYTYLGNHGDAENILIDRKHAINVPYTEVFRSRLMGKTIPKKLRTARWSTYVGNPGENLGSDVLGVYGLLNEYTAYYWGMHTSMSLFDYYKNIHATPEQWMVFISHCVSNRLAYAEFTYYTLNYMAYAKEHNKAVYNGIMNNKSYLKAFTTVEKRFSALNAKLEKRLKQISKILQAEGYTVQQSGDTFFAGGVGISLLTGDYKKLVREMDKSKYQKIFSAMKKNA